MASESFLTPLEFKHVLLDDCWVLERHCICKNVCNVYNNVFKRIVQLNAPLNKQQVQRLNQMGATVRNSKVVKEKLDMNKQKELSARKWLEEMRRDEVLDMLRFYNMMVNVASTVLEQKGKAMEDRP